MNTERNELEGLLKAILEKSDFMYQAIKVDHFDIFENALGERETLISNYLQIVEGRAPETLLADYEAYRGKIDSLNKLIDQELKRFDDKLHKEFIENKKQLAKVTSGHKISKQYQSIHEPLESGRMFDNKK